MNITIKLSTYDPKTPQEATGEIVDIAPHLASVATFIVHKSLYYGWYVSNVESGYRVGREGCHSKKVAMMEAAAILKDKTVDIMLKTYKKNGIK